MAERMWLSLLKIDNLIFFPQGVNEIDKTRKIKIIIWMIISFAFFNMSIFPSGYRMAWSIFVIGILPVMIAFSDQKYVLSKLAKEYPSLKYVLYKNNIIWMVIYIISQICAIESIEEVFIRVCVISIFWALSVMLITIYDWKLWGLTAICVLTISVIFLFWMRTNFMQNDINYIVPIILVISVICISVLVANIQIKKNYAD